MVVEKFGKDTEKNFGMQLKSEEGDGVIGYVGLNHE